MFHVEHYTNLNSNMEAWKNVPRGTLYKFEYVDSFLMQQG